MKKVLLFTVLTFVLAYGVLAAVENKADKTEDKPEVKTSDVNKAESGVEGRRKGRMTGAAFIKFHNRLISQLTKIRDMAVKENALETAKALDEFIAKKQKQLDKKIAKQFKGKGESAGCFVKKKSGNCPVFKDSQVSPADSDKACCGGMGKSGTCPKAGAEKAESGK